jgi:hypothetical protein
MKRLSLSLSLFSRTAGRPIAIICGFAVVLAACQQPPQRYVVQVPRAEVTGKGNGGNPLHMSEYQIEKKMAAIKEPLKKVFVGLRYLAEAERLSTASTELNGRDDLLGLIDAMTGAKASANGRSVFEDIDTSDNLQATSGPCLDSLNRPRAAVALPGDFGGKIRYSPSSLADISPRAADDAVDILILAIAAHEFSHHYMNGDTRRDEALAQSLQDFVNTQLHAANGRDRDVVADGPLSFVDKFQGEAQALLNRAKNSETIRGT